MSDNSLVRQNLEMTATGSIDDLLKASEVVMLLLDTSGSMADYVTVEGQRMRRIDALRKVVANIRAVGEQPPMIAFGGPSDAEVRFVYDVPEPDGGTPLGQALSLAKQYGANRVVVISDGMPNEGGAIVDLAKADFGGQVDTIYIGPKGEGGEFLLEELAKATNGTTYVDSMSDTRALTSKVIGLLEGPAESIVPLQGAGFATVAPEDVVDADEEDEEDDDEETDDDADEDGE